MPLLHASVIGKPQNAPYATFAALLQWLSHTTDLTLTATWTSTGSRTPTGRVVLTIPDPRPVKSSSAIQGLLDGQANSNPWWRCRQRKASISASAWLASISRGCHVRATRSYSPLLCSLTFYYSLLLLLDLVTFPTSSIFRS